MLDLVVFVKIIANNLLVTNYFVLLSCLTRVTSAKVLSYYESAF